MTDPSGPPVGPDELRDIADERHIRRLHAAYVDAVNRFAWPELAQLFLPDAEVTVSRGDAATATVVTGPEAVGAMIAGFVERYDFLVQTVLNARVQLRVGGDPDRAFARLTIAEHRQVSASGRFLASAGTYHDHYRRVDGRWWFARRRYDRTYLSAPQEVEVHPFPTDLGFDDPFAAGG